MTWASLLWQTAHQTETTGTTMGSTDLSYTLSAGRLHLGKGAQHPTAILVLCEFIVLSHS